MVTSPRKPSPQNYGRHSSNLSKETQYHRMYTTRPSISSIHRKSRTEQVCL